MPQKRSNNDVKNASVKHALKISNIVTSAVFSVIIIGVGVFAMLSPKPTYSESEKRELEKKPELTVESLVNGDYTDSFDKYFSDTFPARDRLVDLASRVKNFRGMRAFAKDTKTIHSGDDSMYSTGDKKVEIDEGKFTDAEKIEIGEVDSGAQADDFVPGQIENNSGENATTEDKQDSQELNNSEDTIGSGKAPDTEEEENSKPEKPVGAEGPAGEKRGSLYVVGNTALELFRGNETSSLVYAELINTYAKYMPENINIYNMVVPTHTEFGLPLSDRSVSNEQRPVIDVIKNNLSERVIFVDAYARLREHYENGEYLYFRTDHHWTGLGAYYAYVEFCKTCGIEPVDISAYETGRIEPFLGTFYQSSRDAALKSTPDYVEYYKIDVPCTVTRYDAYGQAYGAKLYYTYVKGEGNSYLAFLGGDFPYMKVVTENKNGKKLMVFKESYGNALVPFLAPHFEEIHIADIRYFPYNAVNFASQYGITDVLLVNGLMSASTGARVDEMYSLLNK